MDLRNHLRVWWRFRLVLGSGLLLAIVLGVLASFRPALEGGLPTLHWRHAAEYTSMSRLFVTQPGFPWGRATLPGSVPGGPAVPKGSQDFATPDRFSNLAIVYAYIAQSDQVRALIRSRPLSNQIVVTPQFLGSGEALPLLELNTKGRSPLAAARLNEATIRALREYLGRESDQSKVPVEQRVELQVLNPPQLGALTAGRSPTLSAVAFILVMVGTFTLMYMLENLYPGARHGRDEFDEAMFFDDDVLQVQAPAG